MIYFVYEKNMEDEVFLNSLKGSLNSLELISAETATGGWNSLTEKIFKFWKDYFILSLTAIKKSKSGDTIITWQVFLGVVTGLLIKIFRMKRELIILSFIYRPRSNKLINRLRYLVTRFGLSSAKKIICYSEYEKVRYTELFNFVSGKFYSTSLGKTYIVSTPVEKESKKYIFSAGQSNRDYDVLIRSIYNIDINLLIATSNEIKIPSKLKTKVKVQQLHGSDFQEALNKSLITILPLKDIDYSSGQVVLINAMALGKCVIITDTNWAIDYLQHGINAWIVPPGDSKALSFALDYLLKNDNIRAKIEKNAKEYYETNLNGKAFAHRLIKIIGE